MIAPEALHQIDKLLGPRGYLDRPEDLKLYEYDGSVDKGLPELVVFPRSAEEAAELVRIAHAHGIAIVGRGAGTGLSGGVIARAGGMIISFARMNRIVEIDFANERAVLEPGVVNLEITQAVERDGYFYAPDPSSQKACTIGGNVAENAGGPHTLAYGVTTNHVLGLEAMLPDGTPMTIGGEAPDMPGYDLTGLLTGSEGTMVLVTKIIVRLMRQPELVKTLLAIYDTVDDCADSVAEITARAITPAAVEMLDGVMLRMVEEATHAGYPMDAAAVLLIELEGLKEAVEEQAAQIEDACKCCRAREVRIARSALERELLWKGRKNAFGAVGRVSPAYYVQDGVVPRTKIAPTLARDPQDFREIRPHHQQHLSRGRWQHASHHPVQSPQAGRTGARERGGRRDPAILHRARRIHHRRAWRGHGKDGADRRAISGRNTRHDRAI